MRLKSYATGLLLLGLACGTDTSEETSLPSPRSPLSHLDPERDVLCRCGETTFMRKSLSRSREIYFETSHDDIKEEEFLEHGFPIPLDYCSPDFRMDQNIYAGANMPPMDEMQIKPEQVRRISRTGPIDEVPTTAFEPVYERGQRIEMTMKICDAEGDSVKCDSYVVDFKGSVLKREKRCGIELTINEEGRYVILSAMEDFSGATKLAMRGLRIR